MDKLPDTASPWYEPTFENDLDKSGKKARGETFVVSSGRVELEAGSKLQLLLVLAPHPPQLRHPRRVRRPAEQHPATIEPPSRFIHEVRKRQALRGHLAGEIANTVGMVHSPLMSAGTPLCLMNIPPWAEYLATI